MSPLSDSHPAESLRDHFARATREESAEEIEQLVDRMVTLYDPVESLDILHALLLLPFHRSHQGVVSLLQRLKSPRSVPFLRQALATPFAYLAYTCSDSDVIAKRFSWALFAIGTPEAVQVLREFAQAADPGVRREMQYRLTKLPA